MQNIRYNITLGLLNKTIQTSEMVIGTKKKHLGSITFGAEIIHFELYNGIFNLLYKITLTASYRQFSLSLNLTLFTFRVQSAEIY